MSQNEEPALCRNSFCGVRGPHLRHEYGGPEPVRATPPTALGAATSRESRTSTGPESVDADPTSFAEISGAITEMLAGKAPMFHHLGAAVTKFHVREVMGRGQQSWKIRFPDGQLYSLTLEKRPSGQCEED